MAILKKKNSSAIAGSILVMTDGADLCCDDAVRKQYATANIDTNGITVSNVNVTVPGGSAQTVALAGAPLDWDVAANDETIIAAVGKVATDLGYEWFDGGITIERTGTNIIFRITDSSLVWNWIGTTTTAEVSFVASSI